MPIGAYFGLRFEKIRLVWALFTESLNKGIKKYGRNLNP